ncbi:MAG: acetylglutamate kinase [Flavobacteriales bacterium]|nr:acetylglutamate kinase [Flavobacteriales bacterium]MCB9449486.1 acetylglutamate kinase [Flavobacteriales bacterium]
MKSLHVVKIGGHVIDDTGKLQDFLVRFTGIKGPKMLVHGGGKIATRTAEQLGIPVKMVDGRRITDKAMLEVVVQVYGGLVNKDIVARLQSLACNAIGMTGADGNVIRAVKRPVKDIDYGYVGDLESVNASLLKTLIEAGLVPVLAPLSHDGNGQMLNTNADTIASSVAIAMADHFDVTLLFGFEKKGVLKDVNDEASVIPEISAAEFPQLKAEGVIAGGMLPKLDNAFAAIQKGVKEVVICQAEEIGNKQTGTRLVP